MEDLDLVTVASLNCCDFKTQDGWAFEWRLNSRTCYCRNWHSSLVKFTCSDFCKFVAFPRVSLKLQSVFNKHYWLCRWRWHVFTPSRSSVPERTSTKWDNGSLVWWSNTGLPLLPCLSAISLFIYLQSDDANRKVSETLFYLNPTCSRFKRVNKK